VVGSALIKHGIPNSMLHDRGSQYKANTSYGKADYQLYAERIGIRLIWANKACTKGKIERFWRFVQDDFIREVWHVTTLKELNQKFQKWLYFYNYQYRSRYFGNHTHSECYHDSERKLTKSQLIKHLTIEQRRKVTRESTISLYGQTYSVPKGYIGCRIWIKILGPKIYFVANDHIFHSTDMKF
jgi:transposase InsO family protein